MRLCSIACCVAVCLTIAASSCARSERTASQPPPPSQKEASYSPFEVVVHGNLPYDVISFKDVGLELQSSEQQLVYETIAESLSLELPAAHGGKVVAQARFSPALDKHADHLDCEGRHVYVDMWRPGGRGWGYSLWSGCSEASNFAWEELPRSDASRIEQLTRPIATSLEQATRTACFTRHC